MWRRDATTVTVFMPDGVVKGNLLELTTWDKFEWSLVRWRNMVVLDSFVRWGLQHKERAVPTLASEDTKCPAIVLARTLEAAGWAPLTGELVDKPDDVVKPFPVVRFSSRRAHFHCLLNLPQSWGLGVRCMPSNDCITFYRCLLKGEVIEPALGDAHNKAVLSQSPDLPAGPALAPQRALPVQTGQPAAIMDAESSESGEILSAGLHDGHAALVVSTAALGVDPFVVAVGSLLKRQQILPRRRVRAASTCCASLTVDD